MASWVVSRVPFIVATPNSLALPGRPLPLPLPPLALSRRTADHAPE
jgi:hypothetical protein